MQSPDYKTTTYFPGATTSRGFTLVELMVALLLGLIVLGALLLSFQATKRSYITQNNFSRTQENGRFAIDMLTKDLRLAGFWGGYEDIATKIIGTATAGAPCNNSTWVTYFPQRLHGLNDTYNAGSGTVNDYSGCIASANNPVEDVITIRRATQDPVTSAGNIVNNGYYILTDFDQAQLVVGTNGTLPKDQDYAAAQFVHQLIGRTYYVRDGTIQCASGPDAGTVTKSLYRYTVSVNGGSLKEEIVGPVEKFQIQYGIDSKGDSKIDNYVTANNVTDWSQVSAVRIWLVVRAACREQGFNDAITYFLPDGSSYTPATAALRQYRRQLYATTVTLRNPVAK